MNILEKGKRYTYVYTATFPSDINGIAMGVGIRTLQGTLMSWAIKRTDSKRQYAKRRIYEFKASFRCLSYSGYYYTTAGVLSEHNELLHQEVDTYTYMVEGLDDVQSFGGYYDSEWHMDICEADS